MPPAKASGAFYHGYKIHANCRMLTVWTFDAKTRRLIGTETCKPKEGLKPDERRKVIADRMEELGVYTDAWIKIVDGAPIPHAGDMVRFIRYGHVYRGGFFFADNDKRYPYFSAPDGGRYWLKTEHVTHWMPDPNPELPQL